MADHRSTSIIDALNRRLSSRPEGVAVRYKRHGHWHELSWARLSTAIEAYAEALAGGGVRAGDTVAIIAENSLEWILSDLAIQARGAVALAVPTVVAPDELGHLLRDHDVKVVICGSREDIEGVLGSGVERAPHIFAISDRGLATFDDARVSLLPSRPEHSGLAATAFNSVHASSIIDVRDDLTVDRMDADRLAALLGDAHTSLKLTEKDRTVVVSPLFDAKARVAELYAPIDAGAVMHMPETIASIGRDIAEVRPTVLNGTSRAFELLHKESVSNYLGSGPIARRTIDWGMGTYEAATVPRHWSPRRIVTRALAGQHGLQALRRIVVNSSGPMHPTAHAFFAAIGADVVEPQHVDAVVSAEGLLRQSPYLSRAIVAATSPEGAHVVLELDFEHVTAWATKAGYDLPTHGALSKSPEVRELVASPAILDRVRQETGIVMNQVTVLPTRLDFENAELTPRLELSPSALARILGERVG